MRRKTRVKNDGYRRWFAVIPFHLSNGPEGVWVWWEWFEWRNDCDYISIRLLPPEPPPDDAREIAAKALDKSYPRIARQIRAGMRSSNWPEDLVDPGLLIDILEARP